MVTGLGASPDTPDLDWSAGAFCTDSIGGNRMRVAHWQREHTPANLVHCYCRHCVGPWIFRASQSRDAARSTERCRMTHQRHIRFASQTRRAAKRRLNVKTGRAGRQDLDPYHSLLSLNPSPARAKRQLGPRDPPQHEHRGPLTPCAVHGPTTATRSRDLVSGKRQLLLQGPKNRTCKGAAS